MVNALVHNAFSFVILPNPGVCVCVLCVCVVCVCGCGISCVDVHIYVPEISLFYTLADNTIGVTVRPCIEGDSQQYMTNHNQQQSTTTGMPPVVSYFTIKCEDNGVVKYQPTIEVHIVYYVLTHIHTQSACTH